MRDIIGPSSAKNTVRTHRTPHSRNSTPPVSGKYGPGRRPSDAGTKNPPEPKLRGMHTSVRQNGSLGRLHVSIVLFERIEALLDLRPRDRQQELIGPEFTVLQYLNVIVLSPLVSSFVVTIFCNGNVSVRSATFHRRTSKKRWCSKASSTRRSLWMRSRSAFRPNP